MECPVCGSTNIEIPTVDIGVGEMQCGPAQCNACGAAQDNEGEWHDHTYWEQA